MYKKKNKIIFIVRNFMAHVKNMQSQLLNTFKDYFYEKNSSLKVQSSRDV